ncbi:MAG: hypothetical protein OEV43_03060 [Coriobacteriia bacterium]|nr:hypothetical protein [Coriobacteriia bacterium]
MSSKLLNRGKGRIMSLAGILEARRHRAYVWMLLVLVGFLLLIFAEVFSPGWACGFLGCPAFLMGGNPFLLVALVGGCLLALLLAHTELRIDREGLRDTLDDERRTLIKLKAWRNAYFGSVVGLFVFAILSGSHATVDMPFLLGAVMVSGAVALFATLVVLDRS